MVDDESTREPYHAAWAIQLGSGYVKKKMIPEAKDAFQRAANDTSESGKPSSAIGLQQLGFYSLTEKSYAKVLNKKIVADMGNLKEKLYGSKGDIRLLKTV